MYKKIVLISSKSHKLLNSLEFNKIIRTKKGYRKLIGESSALFALYGITSMLAAAVFFSWGTAALLALVSGLCLTGLMYYGSAKKFYKRLQ